MPELIVPRAALDLEHLFTPPPSCVAVSLVDSSTAATPRLATTVSAFRNESHLFVIFSGEDDQEIVATHFAHDSNLYDEDALELFLAPDRLERYFEFEVSPRGTLFDAAVDSPQRERSSMHVDRGWDCAGLWAAVRSTCSTTGLLTFTTIVGVPFEPLGGPPASGAEWRANFYRIDRHRSGDLFLAWSPPRRTPPDFHVPDAFGTLRFV